MDPTESPPSRPRNGTPTFLELSSDDPVSTRQFCESVFGWSFGTPAVPTPGGELEFQTPEGGQGRLHSAPKSEAPDQVGRVRVVDLGSTLERATRAGGSLLLPRVEAPGMGSFFVVRVPGGPILTCWEAEAPSRVRHR